MSRYEYIKCFWKFTDNETPVLLFYEVDLAHERHAVRAVEIFPDRSVRLLVQQGVDFVTESPIPTAVEINRESVFHAAVISRDEFECVYQTEKYAESIAFPS